ncbi:E3 ubiquitin-protein ligase SHPRH, partial [Stegodyphus mimosarum]
MMAQCKNCSLIQHTECMLYNTDMSSYDYLCPYCWVDPSQELLLSRGTVIISPASILYQWQQEIAKHVKENTLKVFVYRGVEQHKFINPQDLADHDIILISYEVLRRELGHLNVPHGASRRALRYPQKFSVIPSPLSAIKWWRICLDEAQMVESVTSKAAEMALQLHTINRWCVTGTPIQKSVKDIYGLLLFLKYDPYDSREWFHELLWKPLVNGNIDPMVSVLNQVMWRTSKKNVIEQLGIPMQETVIHKLQLSQVEKVFYETQR